MGLHVSSHNLSYGKLQSIYLVSYKNYFHKCSSLRHSLTHPEPQRSCSVCIMSFFNYSFLWNFLFFSVNKAKFNTALQMLSLIGWMPYRTATLWKMMLLEYKPQDSGTPSFHPDTRNTLLGRYIKKILIYQFVF